MLFFGLVLLRAVLADAAPVLSPDNQYFWYPPCTVAEPDPHNRVERLASGYLTLVRHPRHVIRCIQRKDAVVPVLVSLEVEGEGFLLIYSAELEDSVFPEAALKGLVAHEVAHVSLGLGCSGPIHQEQTDEEHMTCEAEVDREAVRLAGYDAVAESFIQMHKLHLHLAARKLARARSELIDGRLRLLRQQAPAAR